MKFSSSTFLVATTFLSSHAIADGLKQEVSVPLRGEYDSNPQMVSGGGSVYRARVAPQYTLTNVSGANEVALSLGAVIERSSDEALSQDRNDPNASLGWKYLTPTSELPLRTMLRTAVRRRSWNSLPEIPAFWVDARHAL